MCEGVNTRMCILSLWPGLDTKATKSKFRVAEMGNLRRIIGKTEYRRQRTMRGCQMWLTEEAVLERPCAANGWGEQGEGCTTKKTT